MSSYTLNDVYGLFNSSAYNDTCHLGVKCSQKDVAYISADSCDVGCIFFYIAIGIIGFFFLVVFFRCLWRSRRQFEEEESKDFLRKDMIRAHKEALLHPDQEQDSKKSEKEKEKEKEEEEKEKKKKEKEKKKEKKNKSDSDGDDQKDGDEKKKKKPQQKEEEEEEEKKKKKESSTSPDNNNNNNALTVSSLADSTAFSGSLATTKAIALAEEGATEEEISKALVDHDTDDESQQAEAGVGDSWIPREKKSILNYCKGFQFSSGAFLRAVKAARKVALKLKPFSSTTSTTTTSPSKPQQKESEKKDEDEKKKKDDNNNNTNTTTPPTSNNNDSEEEKELYKLYVIAELAASLHSSPEIRKGETDEHRFCERLSQMTHEKQQQLMQKASSSSSSSSSSDNNNNKNEKEKKKEGEKGVSFLKKSSEKEQQATTGFVVDDDDDKDDEEEEGKIVTHEEMIEFNKRFHESIQQFSSLYTGISPLEAARRIDENIVSEHHVNDSILTLFCYCVMLREFDSRDRIARACQLGLTPNQSDKLECALMEIYAKRQQAEEEEEQQELLQQAEGGSSGEKKKKNKKKKNKKKKNKKKEFYSHDLLGTKAVESIGDLAISREEFSEVMMKATGEAPTANVVNRLFPFSGYLLLARLLLFSASTAADSHNRSFVHYFCSSFLQRAKYATLLAAYIPYLVLFTAFMLFGIGYDEAYLMHKTAIEPFVYDNQPFVSSAFPSDCTPSCAFYESFFMKYDEVAFLQDAQDWMNGPLVHALWPYTNQAASSFRFNGVLPVGALRIRQLRSTPNRDLAQEYGYFTSQGLKSSEVTTINSWFKTNSSSFPDLGNVHSTYDSANTALKQDFTNRNDIFHDSTLAEPIKEAFRYRTASQLNNTDFYNGKTALFGGDGYALTIPFEVNGTVARSYITTILTKNWIDMQTRAVVVEFFFYNRQIHILTRIRLVMETTVGGIWVPLFDSTSVHIFNPGSHTFGFFVFLVVFFMYLFLYVIPHGFYTFFWAVPVRALRQRRESGFTAYFYALRHDASQNNWAVLLVLNSTVQLIAWIFRIVHLFITTSSLGNDIMRADYQPAIMDQLTTINRGSIYTSALAITFAYLVPLYYLTYQNDALAVVKRTVSRAVYSLTSLVIVAVMMLAAFAVCAFIAYGAHLPDYRNPALALGQVLLAVIGEYDYDEWRQVHLTFSAVFFFLVTVLLEILLLNMVVSVLMDAFDEEMENLFDADGTKLLIENDHQVQLPFPTGREQFKASPFFNSFYTKWRKLVAYFKHVIFTLENCCNMGPESRFVHPLFSLRHALDSIKRHDQENYWFSLNSAVEDIQFGGYDEAMAGQFYLATLLLPMVEGRYDDLASTLLPKDAETSLDLDDFASSNFSQSSNSPFGEGAFDHLDNPPPTAGDSSSDSSDSDNNDNKKKKKKQEQQQEEGGNHEEEEEEEDDDTDEHLTLLGMLQENFGEHSVRTALLLFQAMPNFHLGVPSSVLLLNALETRHRWTEDIKKFTVTIDDDGNAEFDTMSPRAACLKLEGVIKDIDEAFFNRALLRQQEREKTVREKLVKKQQKQNVSAATARLAAAGDYSASPVTPATAVIINTTQSDPTSFASPVPEKRVLVRRSAKDVLLPVISPKEQKALLAILQPLLEENPDVDGVTTEQFTDAWNELGIGFPRPDDPEVTHKSTEDEETEDFLFPEQRHYLAVPADFYDISEYCPDSKKKLTQQLQKKSSANFHQVGDHDDDDENLSASAAFAATLTPCLGKATIVSFLDECVIAYAERKRLWLALRWDCKQVTNFIEAVRKQESDFNFESLIIEEETPVTCSDILKQKGKKNNNSDGDDDDAAEKPEGKVEGKDQVEGGDDGGAAVEMKTKEEIQLEKKQEKLVKALQAKRTYYTVPKIFKKSFGEAVDDDTEEVPPLVQRALVGTTYEEFFAAATKAPRLSMSFFELVSHYMSRDSSLFFNTTAYLVFVIMFTYFACSNRGMDELVWMTEGTKENFATQQFVFQSLDGGLHGTGLTKITDSQFVNLADLQNWKQFVEQIIITGAFNGPSGGARYVDGTNTVTPVGAIVIRQRRRANQSCIAELDSVEPATIPDLTVRTDLIGRARMLEPQCITTNTDTLNFGDATTVAALSSANARDAFKYRSCSQLGLEGSYRTDFNTFSCDGHALVIPLNMTATTATTLFQSVWDAGWIDTQTSVLAVHLTTFNYNLNVFGRWRFFAEVTGGGMIHPVYDVVNVYPWIASAHSNVFKGFLGLFFFFVLLQGGATLFSIYDDIRRETRTTSSVVRALVRALTEDYWWVVNLTNVVILVVIWSWRFNQMQDETKDIRLFDPAVQPRIEELAENTVIFDLVESFCAILTYFRITYYLRSFPSLNLLARTLFIAMKEIRSLVLIFVIVFLGFGLSAFFVIGAVNINFATPDLAFGTLFRVLLGADLSFQDMIELHPIWSGVFYACFIISCEMVLFNLIIAVLNSSLEQARAETCDIEPFEIAVTEDSRSGNALRYKRFEFLGPLAYVWGAVWTEAAFKYQQVRNFFAKHLPCVSEETWRLYKIETTRHPETFWDTFSRVAEAPNPLRAYHRWREGLNRDCYNLLQEPRPADHRPAPEKEADRKEGLVMSPSMSFKKNDEVKRQTVLVPNNFNTIISDFDILDSTSQTAERIRIRRVDEALEDKLGELTDRALNLAIFASLVTEIPAMILLGQIMQRRHEFLMEREDHDGRDIGRVNALAEIIKKKLTQFNDGEEMYQNYKKRMESEDTSSDDSEDDNNNNNKSKNKKKHLFSSVSDVANVAVAAIKLSHKTELRHHSSLHGVARKIHDASDAWWKGQMVSLPPRDFEKVPVAAPSGAVYGKAHEKQEDAAEKKKKKEQEEEEERKKKEEEEKEKKNKKIPKHESSEEIAEKVESVHRVESEEQHQRDSVESLTMTT